ncbi:roadblock/LC7 domain-containing protein [Streptomyces sp. NPDC048208]|uniref:roadblock/LC7 domain-containing protein n=1 Tax=Streptomyces sp. NPDC048208 TaxID=3365515 RepID=UPI0037116585
MTTTSNLPGATSGRQDMEWLLKEFATANGEVTHAVLLSRDGLRLLDSGVDKDWADELAAGISGLASLGKNLTGPTHAKVPPKLMFVERDDCFFLIQGAGRSTAFGDQPGTTRGVLDTILVVITTPKANVGTVSYEIGRLVAKFAPYMETSVRVAAGDDAQ